MTIDTKTKNRQFRLKTRPVERVTGDNFDFVESPLSELSKNSVLIRNVFLSLDPTNRIWMSDVDQYMPPVKIGEVMRGFAIGQAEESNNPDFRVGEFVAGMLGWQDYFVACYEELKSLSKLSEIPGVPVQVFASAAGMTGLTAYYGLFEIGKPKEGETLVVSAAAGAVGSIVGQLGKLNGLRVVGIAGGKEKCAWLTDELCFDAAVDYKHPDWKEHLQAATPDGIDINFENVGGEIMETVYSRMNLFGRMVLCGMISGYNEKDDSKSRLSLSAALMKRLTIRGFIVTDFAHMNREATTKLATWIGQGKLKHSETIVDGLENAPEALNKLFDGGNVGKLLIKVSDCRPVGRPMRASSKMP
ncbi:MAG: NADP-dependent oxidoreductase [Candidatus Obscuribacterales bacterium]|nr:NADP-dependent oxidoreductase [Candidatus Obscuribacterales bacterium]